MNELQRHYLGAMGIQVWEERIPSPADEVLHDEPAVLRTGGEGEAEAVTPVSRRQERSANQKDAVDTTIAAPEPVHSDRVAENTVASLDWSTLQERVGQCRQCDELVANRTQTVFGIGNPHAELLVIGEAPGADEDRQGEPFVGRAGQLLNAMLSAIGQQRSQVYIANVLKCRPPNNRDPKPEEATACAPFLQRQIALIQPKVILVVGRIAAQNLLLSDAPIGQLRGRVHQLDSGVPVVVTYHPAYLLRTPREKRKAWLDLCLVMDVLAGQKGGER